MANRIDKELFVRNLVPSRAKAQEFIKAKFVLCNGKIVEKKTRKGKIFYGCSNYPKCKTACWDKPTGEVCPDCGKLLVEKNGTVKCSECSYQK